MIALLATTMFVGMFFGVLGLEAYQRHRKKKRCPIDSKTPYDYALTNARADNERYRDELRTIQATKRIEADTERIRNEIDTVLSDDGEEPTEGTYDEERRRREFVSVGKRWEANMKELYGDWEIPKIYNPTSDGRESLPIQQHDDGTISPILPHAGELDTSTIMAMTGMEAEEWADSISKKIAEAYGTNVREFEHVVTSGETLSTICYKYKRMPSKLLEYNKLESLQNIHVGQVLIIPEED